MRLSHLPLRVSTGAFILNAGLGKRGIDGETAAALQGMGSAAVPQLTSVSPQTFGSLLSKGEMALGAALLAPFVSPVLAGAALAAFGGGLVQMYLKTPGMTEPDGFRPTQAGTGLAKDVWLLGAGLALVLDGLSDGTRRTARKTKKKAKKALSSVTSH